MSHEPWSDGNPIDAGADAEVATDAGPLQSREPVHAAVPIYGAPMIVTRHACGCDLRGTSRAELVGMGILFGAVVLGTRRKKRR
jgi:hypothetical protein